MKTIPFFGTYVDKKAFSLVSNTLKSTFLSEGKLVAEFESQLAQELGLLHPVAVNSGTSALHLALIVSGIGQGDEVIIPAQTFIATGLSLLYVGAKPIFADIQYETGNIDAISVEKRITKKTRAILPVHWGGNPVDLAPLHALAKKHNLTVIEDAAHALGATYRKKPIGAVSDFTCFSFQAIKHLTTGDGGAIAFRSAKDEQRAKKLRWFGIDRRKAKPSILGERQYDLDEIGYKYHLNDYAAALGIANLTQFQQRLKRRAALAERYRKKLSHFSGIQLFEKQEDRTSSHWLFGLHVEKRNQFIRALADNGISTSVVHQGIDRYSLFGGEQKKLSQQRRFDASQIHLPLYDSMKTEDVDYIVETIKQGW